MSSDKSKQTVKDLEDQVSNLQEQVNQFQISARVNERLIQNLQQDNFELEQRKADLEVTLLVAKEQLESTNTNGGK